MEIPVMPVKNPGFQVKLGAEKPFYMPEEGAPKRRLKTNVEKQM